MGSLDSLKRLAPSAALRTLESVRVDFGGRAGARKLELLRSLANRDLPRASEVERLHEVLCFLRAYPDDPRLLRQVERMLHGFEQRTDLRAHRDALASTGIAGTAIRFRFFAPMASWLARRWPEHLTIDWPGFDDQDGLEALLPLLVHYAETPAIDEYDFTIRQWIERLKSPRERDATFLIRRFDRLPMDAFAREILYDQLDVPMVLSPAADTPSRTTAKYGRPKVAVQRRPLSRIRPDLRREIVRPPRSVRMLSPREAGKLIDSARAAMLTRQRDLDVFSYGDERDVRLIDYGGGLQFACIGAIPERRLLLEAVYGFLTLKNGIPVGYVLTSALFGSSEIAYNVFETFRGVEAAAIYARVLAMTRTLFGTDAFAIYPYQLGQGNQEALASGAWWFYQKVGFRPAEARVRRLMEAELGRMKRDPSHRSSRAVLERLSRGPLFYYFGRRREDVIGKLDLANVGLHVSRYLAQRFGADRERAAAICTSEAAKLLGGSGRALPDGERQAWERWGPLVLILPGIQRWRPADRTALATVVRAKGGTRESDFVRLFDAHRPLRQAIHTLARRAP